MDRLREATAVATVPVQKSSSSVITNTSNSTIDLIAGAALSPPKAASLPSGALHLCLYALSSMDNTYNNSLNSSPAVIIPQAFHPFLSLYTAFTNAWNSLAKQPPTPLLTKVLRWTMVTVLPHYISPTMPFVYLFQVSTRF